MINFNSTNYNNFFSNIKINVRNSEDKSSSTLNSKLSSQISSKNSSTEVLGYKIDKDGYFTEEFNKIAGIPNDYKIHSSTMQSFAKMGANQNNFFRTFDSIDIAKSVGNAYAILSQVVGFKF
ncbi:Cj0814 family flagellar-dependent secreted protein [Campylobacter troglodytis]|uniref:Cj0814 family flagellar-dependent secreted protein n=1 Tax=Campylobacter troglodytis TaxID=654363 RepID=UPI0011591D12|nr:hypothetical protein [Campylobacter troglodytis]TQR61628.1 hypothetical protein DMC01_00220 [Campylobacter troglodytis]